MVTKKKKQQKNADFKKVKLKVGKKLKKTTTTDTTITAKKVILSTQLDEKEGSSNQPLSYRGLTLDELCKQLGHFNKNVRKDAIVGAKQLLSSRPDLIESQLRNLIPSIARLISDSTSDQAFNAQLKALLQVICTVPSRAMSPHFPLFMAHLLRAITHMELSVRMFSLSILSMVFACYPDLCRHDGDLFRSFAKFLASSRKPSWSTGRFLETVDAFLKIYDKTEDLDKKPIIDVSLNTETGKTSSPINLLAVFQGKCPFDFPLMASRGAGHASPYELPENIIQISEVLVPILLTSLIEDKAGQFLAPSVSILERLGRAVDNQRNIFLVGDFNQRMGKIWEPIKKAAAMRKTEKVKAATSWIQRF